MHFHKSLAVTALAVATVASMAASVSPAAATATPGFGQAAATPHTNLVSQETISVKFSGFTTDPDGTVVYAEQCVPGVVSAAGAANPNNYCDAAAAAADPAFTETASGAGTISMKVLAGSDFSAGLASSKCDAQHSCIILVADSLTAPSYIAEAPISFKDLRAASVTTATAGAKSGKVGKSVKVSAKTTHTATGTLSGKVVFKDDGKTFATVTEAANGKVSAKAKLKAGKNKITATYSGNTVFKGSTSKAVTIKGIKPKKK